MEVDPKMIAVIDAVIKKSNDEATKLKKLDEQFKSELAKALKAASKN